MYRRKYSRSRHFPILPLLMTMGLVLLVVGGLVISKKKNVSLATVQNDLASKFQNKYSFSFPKPEVSLTEYARSLFGAKLEHEDPVFQQAEHIGRIAVFSDSHSSIETFASVMEKIETENVELLIHLGDVTSGGEQTDFERIKTIMDQTGIEYYVIPGDHDYNWVPSYDLQNFYSVFGSNGVENFRVLEFRNYSLVLLDNSLSSEEDVQATSRVEDILQKYQIKGRQIIFFTSTPFYNPYFSSKSDKNGEEILQLLAKYGVEQVFSGDAHIFSRYVHDDSAVTITTVGATGDYKNLLPQYVVVDLYNNGDIDIKAKPAVEVESGD